MSALSSLGLKMHFAKVLRGYGAPRHTRAPPLGARAAPEGLAVVALTLQGFLQAVADPWLRAARSFAWSPR